jgi:hypothetical protein
MRNAIVIGVLAVAVLAAAACGDNPTVPRALTTTVKRTNTPPGTDTQELDLWSKDLVGTWQATKAEGTYSGNPPIRRDLVAEGGTVTLVLEANETQKTFTVTLTMPGEAPRINYGIWYCWNHDGRPQVDFWPGWIPKEELEYGDGIGMYFALDNSTLILTDGGGNFLRYDFSGRGKDGWDCGLEMVLTRSGS